MVKLVCLHHESQDGEGSGAYGERRSVPFLFRESLGLHESRVSSWNVLIFRAQIKADLTAGQEASRLFTDLKGSKMGSLS